MSANNLNDNYNNLHCANDHYQVPMHGERNMMADWNPIIALWRHLLNNTMTIQEVFTNASILILTELFGDYIKMKQCDLQKFDLNNTEYFYSNDKTKDDFASTITVALFEDDRITPHAREARIEYIFTRYCRYIHKLFAKSTEYLPRKPIQTRAL